MWTLSSLWNLINQLRIRLLVNKIDWTQIIFMKYWSNHIFLLKENFFAMNLFNHSSELELARSYFSGMPILMRRDLEKSWSDLTLYFTPMQLVRWTDQLCLVAELTLLCACLQNYSIKCMLIKRFFYYFGNLSVDSPFSFIMLPKYICIYF